MTSPLRPAVRATWIPFSREHEGRYAGMYLDSKAIPTTAVGFALFTVEEALALPWFDKHTGQPASASAIRGEYLKVGSTKALAILGADAAMRMTDLRISEATIDRLTLSRLDVMVADLASQFPAFGSWPADAQRALCSLSWAQGSGIIPRGKHAGWPKLTAALLGGDFATASTEIKLDESKTKGVVRRNEANRLGMLAAAKVVERGADPDQLCLTPDGVPGADPVEPVPDTEPSREAREAYAASVLGTRATVAELAREGRDRGDED